MTTSHDRLKNRKVLISGASIAGPALAFWLRRHGFQPTVVERAPALRPGGYKIDIRGVAIEVVERMGLLADVRAARTDMQGASYVDGRGKRVADIDIDLFGMREPRDVEIMRGDLARLLYERTRGEVEYLFDDSITGLSQDGDGVAVSFERGPGRRFDLVVGADGLHSNVRALAFGDEAQFSHHLGHYVSIFTVPNFLELDRWELAHALPGRLVTVYSTRQDPTCAKALFLFAAPPLTYDRRDGARQRQLLAEAYADPSWELPRLLREMNEAPDFYFDSLSTIRMEEWSRGRATLVGDAAYCASPASGQGTSLALVGAYVLAGELAAAGGDHEAAFAAYQRELSRFVELNQKIADNVSQMVPRSRWQLRVQTFMLRLLPLLPGKTFLAKKIQQQIREAANAITLKPYA